MMLQSIMTSRGQITIPAKIREKLRLNSGNKLEFIIKNDYILMVPVNKNLKELKGILAKPKIKLSCEEMNEVIKAKANLK